MGVFKFIFRLVGWLLTVAIQIATSFLIILLLSIIFAGVDTTSRLGWLFLLLCIWFGYVVGINLVGYPILRWVWRNTNIQLVPRLIGTMVGALIPLLILLPIGYSVPVGDAGTRFYDLVSNNWQPILAQASLFAAILGYYLPSIFRLAGTRSPASTKSS